MPNWLRTFGHPVPVSSTFPDGYGISSAQRSLIVSILSAGTFFGSFYHPAILPSSDLIHLGALTAAPMGDIIGRKWGIILACLVFSIGVALQTAATSLSPFIVGRVWAGLGVGMVSTLVPMSSSKLGSSLPGSTLSSTLGQLSSLTLGFTIPSSFQLPPPQLMSV